MRQKCENHHHDHRVIINACSICIYSYCEADWAFVLAYAVCWFSRDMAHLSRKHCTTFVHHKCAYILQTFVVASFSHPSVRGTGIPTEKLESLQPPIHGRSPGLLGVNVNPYRASKYFTDWVLTADKVGAIL